MPLRDHFRAPVNDESSWEGLHGGWPMMIVADLATRLPQRYVAAPRVHVGASVEVDVATYEHDAADAVDPRTWSVGEPAARAPPQATLAVATDLPAQNEYEVRVYDTRRGRRLVAAIELVSPANKDRPEHRRAFVAKCAALLHEQVSVVVVDLVTMRQGNLYAGLLEVLGQVDETLQQQPPPIYAVACRTTRRERQWLVETWFHPLALGQPLPTLPLRLADNLAVPLDLEASYEETCRILRIA